MGARVAGLKREPPSAVSASWGSFASGPWLIWCVLGLAATLVGAARLRFAITEPLWFDEAFSLEIISRPDWTGFWREVYLDSNGPAYYLLLRLWAGVFGHSDVALRLPGLLAVWIAGLLPLVAAPRSLDRGGRITWAALVFCWWGVGYFLDARCYSLLLAVSTWQCLCFARLMDEPGGRRALVWAATAASAILAHYYALFLGLAQGLIYLGRRRQAALRTWPAALAFVPAFGWIAYHAPRLADYSRRASIWHPPLDAGRILGLVSFVFGPGEPLVLPLVAAILTGGLLWARLRPAATLQAGEARPAALTLTAGSGVLAFTLMLGFGLAGSGLSPRYMVPVAPPLLLGVVLLAGVGGRARLSYAALIALYAGLLVRPTLEAAGPPRALPRYEFETGSAWLMAHGISDVVFVWDHELTPIMQASTLTQVGGVFFQRAGYPVRIRPLVVDAAHDANAAILAAARGPRPGLIWLFNRDGRTAAHAFAPAISRADPDWTCASQGEGTAGGLACYRRPRAP